MFFVLINKKLSFHITVTAVDKIEVNQWAVYFTPWFYAIPILIRQNYSPT